MDARVIGYAGMTTYYDMLCQLPEPERSLMLYGELRLNKPKKPHARSPRRKRQRGR